MNQEPKPMNRRKFIYAGLGAIIIIVGGVAAYFATRPPEVIEKTIVQTVSGTPTTIVKTVPTTVEKTVATTIEKPVEKVITTTVERPVEKTVVTTIAGTPTTVVKTETLTTTVEKTITPAPKTIKTVGPFTFWTEKGYAPSEDEAWDWAVKTFCRNYGIADYEITRASPKDLDIKLTAAIDAGNPPDAVNAALHSEITQGAYKGLLEELDDLIKPVLDKLSPLARESAYLYNAKEKKTAIYSAPWDASGYFLHINKELIKKAGEDPEKIPSDWEGWHEFFKGVQKKLRAKGLEVYGLGYPMSTASMGDGPNMVMQLFKTMGGEGLKDGNKFVLGDPKNKKIFVEVIDILTNFMKEGYVPKEALTWGPPDNNIHFIMMKSVTMWNGSLSIPMYWLNKDPNVYYDVIATVDAPTGPNGEEWNYLMWTGGVITYKKSKNKEAGREFCRYMLEPEVGLTIIRTMLGRVFPMRLEAAEAPDMKSGFVKGGKKDPNFPAFYRQLFERKSTMPVGGNHPAFEEMVIAGIWTDPCSRVVVDGWDPEKAVEESIERAKKIWEKWTM